MAFTFLKAQGKNIGLSLVDKANLKTARDILKNAEDNKVRLLLPQDVVSATEIANDASWRVSTIDKLHPNEIGLDIGPETSLKYELMLSSANTIIWNGPLGLIEIPAFSTGTQAIASAVRDQTEEGAISIIGGGDTASALKNYGISDGFTHISTGGGASLQLMSGKQLPAMEAIHEYA